MQDTNTKLSKGDIITEKILTKNQAKERQYKVLEEIGDGSYSTCYTVQYLKTNELYACKVLHIQQLKKDHKTYSVEREIEIHQSLTHNNIIKLRHHFQDNTYHYIFLELAENKTLQRILEKRKTFTELEAAYYSSQAIKAMIYLKENNILHRDIKLSNMLVTNKMEVKICDFGLARKIDKSEKGRNSFCGTPNYMSPEIVEKKPYLYESDLWSLGVCIYTMLYGKPPFTHRDEELIYENIVNLKYVTDSFSQEAQDLISSIFVKNPKERIKINEILDHPFFKNYILDKNLPPYVISVQPSEEFISTLRVNSLANMNKNMQIDENPYFSKTLDKRRQSKKKDTIKIQTATLKATTLKRRQSVKVLPTETPVSISTHDRIYIIECLDHNFGMGYLLSNFSIGVFFTDNTTLIMEENEIQLYYFANNSKKDEMLSFEYFEIPKDLKKKVSILEHFKKVLEREFSRRMSYIRPSFDYESEKSKGAKEYRSKLVVFVAKWARSKRCYVFRLSTVNFQIFFKDLTSIIILTESREFNYMNYKGDLETYPLKQCEEILNVDITKRIMYSKKILEAIRKFEEIKKKKARGEKNQGDSYDEKKTLDMITAKDKADNILDLKENPGIDIKVIDVIVEGDDENKDVSN